MTEPSFSNPPSDSNRFCMSSNTISQQPPLLLQSNINIINNNNNNFYPPNSMNMNNNSNNFNMNEEGRNSGNQTVGILDILSGGNQQQQQQLKGNNSFSSNQTAPISSSNSNRNLNPSARKSLPSTSTLSPYQLQSPTPLDSSFSPRFARQFSQPPLSFVNEQDSANMNNEELSGGEEEIEMNPSTSKSNDQQNSNGQPTSSNGTGNTRRMNYACTECRKAHKACTGERPCDRCKKLGMEDKCKSTIRKKRILTKRYWVHFMSNDGNTNSMMDDSSAGDQSPASIIPQQPFLPGSQSQLGNARNASMNYKRHSSANLPSFSSVKRLNQGLSGGSTNSMSSLSLQGSEMMSSSDASMLNPNEYNNMYSGDRSPRQIPHSYNYHPYKSPRGQHPEQVMDQSSPNQPLQQQNNNGFTSPRNSFNRAASSSQIPSQLQLQQQQQLQQGANYNFPAGSASLDAYRMDGKTGNSLESSPSPRDSGILNHLNSSTFNNSVGSQLDPQTVNRHYNRGSMRIQPLFNQHTKSLSDTNLLPSPSMLLDHQRQQSMFNFPTHSSANTANSNTNSGMAVDEFSNQNNIPHHHGNLHIPPIMLEKNPNVPQFTIQPSPANNSNSNTPRSGILFENSPRSSNMGSGGEYYYSPRSELDYSSDMSSLNNSPRFGNGGADSNSSTPRSLIGSMNGMSINDTSPLSQQLSQQYPPGYRGSLHYDSPSLMVPGNRKSVAGYLNQAGNRFSLGSNYHGSAYVQQQQQQNAPNSSSTATGTYTNHPGNRYSLGPNQDLYQYSTRSTNFRK